MQQALQPEPERVWMGAFARLILRWLWRRR